MKMVEVLRRLLAWLTALVRDNKRTSAVSASLVTMLIVLGYEAHATTVFVGAGMGFLAALLASDGDTKSVLRQQNQEAAEDEDAPPSPS